MRKPLNSRLPAGSLLVALLALLLAAWAVAPTTAKYAAAFITEGDARAAAFDVEITPPAGVYLGEALPPGESNPVSLANMEGTEHPFLFANNGDVTVDITLAVEGDAAACQLDETGFRLKAGETHIITVTLWGDGTDLEEIIYDFAIQILIEQVD